MHYFKPSIGEIIVGEIKMGEEPKKPIAFSGVCTFIQSTPDGTSYSVVSQPVPVDTKDEAMVDAIKMCAQAPDRLAEYCYMNGIDAL